MNETKIFQPVGSRPGSLLLLLLLLLFVPAPPAATSQLLTGCSPLVTNHDVIQTAGFC